MAVMCDDLNLLFIMVPGTGCSVVGEVLRRNYGGRTIPDAADGPTYKHASLQKLIADSVVTAQELRNLTVFATVRNPFDRFATEYQRIAGDWIDEHKNSDRPRSRFYQQRPAKYWVWKEKQQAKARERGFDWWLTSTVNKYRIRNLLRNPLKYRQMLTQLAYPLSQGVTSFIRYENLQQELAGVLRDQGADTSSLELPRKNVTPGKKPYTEYYSDRSRHFVERVFSQSLRGFGHCFDGLIGTSAPAPSETNAE